MDLHKFQHVFCEIMPVMYKASPLIAGYIGSPLTYLIIGLLAAVAKCDPEDHEGIAKKLHNDPDLYTTLEKLESTHAEWLKNLPQS